MKFEVREDRTFYELQKVRDAKMKRAFQTFDYDEWHDAAMAGLPLYFASCKRPVMPLRLILWFAEWVGLRNG